MFDLQSAKQMLERQHSVNSMMWSFDINSVIESVSIPLQNMNEEDLRMGTGDVEEGNIYLTEE